MEDAPPRSYATSRAASAMGLSPEQFAVVERRLASEAAKRTEKEAKKHMCKHGAVNPSEVRWGSESLAKDAHSLAYL